MSMENVWKLNDSRRTIDDVYANWDCFKEDVGDKYFITECCPPGGDCIEEYCYKSYIDMYYHRLSMLEMDRQMAIDDEDYDREPMEYNFYYEERELEKIVNGIKYYRANRCPVKVYKYGGKLKCKYI